jgi:hypothetical protein
LISQSTSISAPVQSPAAPPRVPADAIGGFLHAKIISHFPCCIEPIKRLTFLQTNTEQGR